MSAAQAVGNQWERRAASIAVGVVLVLLTVVTVFEDQSRSTTGLLQTDIALTPFQRQQLKAIDAAEYDLRIKMANSKYEKALATMGSDSDDITSAAGAKMLALQHIRAKASHSATSESVRDQKSMLRHLGLAKEDSKSAKAQKVVIDKAADHSTKAVEQATKDAAEKLSTLVRHAAASKVPHHTVTTATGQKVSFASPPLQALAAGKKQDSTGQDSTHQQLHHPAAKASVMSTESAPAPNDVRKAPTGADMAPHHVLSAVQQSLPPSHEHGGAAPLGAAQHSKRHEDNAPAPKVDNNKLHPSVAKKEAVPSHQHTPAMVAPSHSQDGLAKASPARTSAVAEDKSAAIAEQHPASKALQHPASKALQHPASKPSQHPASKPSQHPASKPSQHPASKPSQHPASKPSQHPASKPSQLPQAAGAQATGSLAHAGKQHAVSVQPHGAAASAAPQTATVQTAAPLHAHAPHAAPATEAGAAHDREVRAATKGQAHDESLALVPPHAARAKAAALLEPAESSFATATDGGVQHRADAASTEPRPHAAPRASEAEKSAALSVESIASPALPPPQPAHAKTGATQAVEAHPAAATTAPAPSSSKPSAAGPRVETKTDAKAQQTTAKGAARTKAKATAAATGRATMDPLAVIDTALKADDVKRRASAVAASASDGGSESKSNAVPDARRAAGHAAEAEAEQKESDAAEINPLSEIDKAIRSDVDSGKRAAKKEAHAVVKHVAAATPHAQPEASRGAPHKAATEIDPLKVIDAAYASDVKRNAAAAAERQEEQHAADARKQAREHAEQEAQQAHHRHAAHAKTEASTKAAAPQQVRPELNPLSIISKALKSEKKEDKAHPEAAAAQKKAVAPKEEKRGSLDRVFGSAIAKKVAAMFHKMHKSPAAADIERRSPEVAAPPHQERASTPAKTAVASHAREKAAGDKSAGRAEAASGAAGKKGKRDWGILGKEEGEDGGLLEGKTDEEALQDLHKLEKMGLLSSTAQDDDGSDSWSQEAPPRPRAELPNRFGVGGQDGARSIEGVKPLPRSLVKVPHWYTTRR